MRVVTGTSRTAHRQRELQIKHRRLLRSAGRWDDSRVEPHAADATVELDQPLHAQFEEFLDEYRAAINACLDGLSEEQARRSLVASKTTLLGLVKHATFVEQVWFDQAVTCRTRADLGIPETADDSFDLDDGDTITSVQEAHRKACASSRGNHGVPRTGRPCARESAWPTGRALGLPARAG